MDPGRPRDGTDAQDPFRSSGKGDDGGQVDVGIWHETFKVRAGEYECLYGNMRQVGLAAAAEHMPVGRKTESAAQRIGVAVTEPGAEPTE